MDISTQVSFIVATGATVHGSFVLDTVVTMFADVGGLTKLGVDLRTFVNMFSRHERSVSVLRPQGCARGSDRDAGVIPPRLVLNALKEMLSVHEVFRLDTNGLVSCFFPHKTPRGIDRWMGRAAKSWRDVRNVCRHKFLAGSQGTGRNIDDACVGNLQTVDPTLVSDESANVVLPAPQFVWNYMGALIMTLCPDMFEDASKVDVAYGKGTTAMRRFTETGHSIFLSVI